ncbi:MAG: ABC transporter ATP-binding protein [Acidimicrobiales bacterium]
MTNVLTFEGVTKTFGSGSTETRALDSVSVTVAHGEMVAVMGPSGCGKSTLLHLAGGLEPPTAGQVVACGRNLGDASAAELSTLRRNDVGYVFQRLNLIPSLTAVENVMLPLELDGIGSRQARIQAMESLELVGLSGHLDRYPDDFSGGQQQRIAIARAVTGTRQLLLADEPTGSLDTLAADSIIELLSSITRERGTAIVLVTHEPRFAAWADRTIYLRDGRVVDHSGTNGARRRQPAETTPSTPATVEAGR